MPRNILIVKSSSMGDIVHALPVAYDIKQVFPDARLSWVVESSFREIIDLSPWIDHSVVTSFRSWRKSPFSRETWESISALKTELQQARFDLVVDLQGLMRSALVARWTGAPTVGYSRQTIREPLAAYAYHKTLDVPESLTPVRRYRVMAARALGYSIDENDPHYALKVKAVTPLGITRPYVALAVNTSRPEKLWPNQRWIAVGQQLAKQGFQSVLFWGNDREYALVEQIARGVPNSVIAPRSGLKAIAEMLQGAECVLGVDTGLTHLAAALGKPSVGIIVGTSAALFSLVSEGPCVTVGDEGVVPSVDAVLKSIASVYPKFNVTVL